MIIKKCDCWILTGLHFQAVLLNVSCVVNTHCGAAKLFLNNEVYWKNAFHLFCVVVSGNSL